MSAKPRRTYDIEVRSPFPPHNFYLLYDWALPVWKNVASDGAPTDREGFVERQIEIAETPGVKTWGIYRDGELGGYVAASWPEEKPWVAQAHCIFRKEFWGGNTTETSLRRVAQQIFDSDTIKIEMWVFADNHAVKGLIRRLGGREEGCLSAQAMRDGQLVDMCVYALTPDSLARE